MKLQNSKLVELNQQFKEGTALHAYIIEGEKSEIPQLLNQCAKLVLCKNHACDSCEICKKINSNSHFDHIKLPLHERTKLLVEDINFLVEESIKRPIEATGENRVFTLGATESTSMIQGEIWQNKLLKILEEPPKNIYIFIGTTNKNSLLPTVLSRCQVVCSKPLSTAEVCQFLQDLSFKEDVSQMVAALSQGSTLNAQKLMSDNLICNIFDFCMKMLAELTSTKDALQYVSVMTSEQYKNRISDFLTILTLILRESILKRTFEKQCSLTCFEEEILKVCKNYSVQAAGVCIEKLNQTKKRLDNNGNLNVEIDNLIVDMLEVKYICRL